MIAVVKKWNKTKYHWKNQQGFKTKHMEVS